MALGANVCGPIIRERSSQDKREHKWMRAVRSSSPCGMVFARAQNGEYAARQIALVFPVRYQHLPLCKGQIQAGRGFALAERNVR